MRPSKPPRVCRGHEATALTRKDAFVSFIMPCRCRSRYHKTDTEEAAEEDVGATEQPSNPHFDPRASRPPSAAATAAAAARMFSASRSFSRSNHERRGSPSAVPPLLLCLLFLVPLTLCGSVSDCQGVRYAYRERGIDLRDVPRQPRQGKGTQKVLLLLFWVSLSVRKGLEKQSAIKAAERLFSPKGVE